VLPSNTDRIETFRVPLPTDGTHAEVVIKARSCGMRWTQLQASRAIEACKKAGGAYMPTLGLLMNVEGNVSQGLAGVIHKIESCNRVRALGLGHVPDTSRKRLERLRDVCQHLAQALDELLAPGPPLDTD
jgi:hypothetical protein